MSNTEEIQNAEDRLRAMSPDRSSFHRLEELVCGQLFWRAIAKRSDRKLSAMLNDENISNESSEFVRRDLFTDRCHERADYGRSLNDKTQSLVNFLYGEKFTQSEIRDAIFGRIIYRDGTHDFDWMRKYFLMVSACCWHVITLVTSLLLIILSFCLPGSLTVKFTVGLGIAFCGFCSCVFMHSLAIRPILIWEKTRIALKAPLSNDSFR